MVQLALLKFDLKVKLAGLLVKLSLLFIFTDVLPSKHCLNLKLTAETRSEVIRKDFLTNLRHTEGSGALFTFQRRKPGHLHLFTTPRHGQSCSSPAQHLLPLTALHRGKGQGLCIDMWLN